MSIVKAIAFACIIGLAMPQRIGLYIQGAAAPSDVINVSDLSCAGVFLAPDQNTGIWTTTYPVTYYYLSGVRTYLQLDGNGHVVEFPEPTLSACNTAIGSVTTASYAAWGADWGQFAVNAGGNYVPGLDSNVKAQGLFYDTGTSQLFMSWFASYAAVVQHNSLGASTLTQAGHVMTRVGCWGFDTPYNMTQVGSGVLQIPSSFVSNYLAAGRNLAVGFGGYIGYAVANSFGPVLVAINPPASNACASGTDYFLSSYTELERHASGNSAGPNCHPTPTDDPATWVGCTPTQTPTTPYAGQQAFANYSMALYPQTWDPYGGHGWLNGGQQLGWYDDGVKHGVVSVFGSLSGWVNQTILPSPTPTYTGGSTGTGTFSITSTDSHDGYHINPGDALWLQTCTPGVDSGCAVNNGNMFSIIKVNTVNNGTGAIAFTTTSADPSAGNHAPVVGGGAYLTWFYAHGAPCLSRSTILVQAYDPASYADVIAGAQPYNVRYATERSGAALFGTQMGDPSLGAGVASSCEGFPSNISISSVMTDASHHQIMVNFGQAVVTGGHNKSLIVVLNVNQAAPSPVPLMPLAFLTAISLGIFWTRRMGVS